MNGHFCPKCERTWAHPGCSQNYLELGEDSSTYRTCHVCDPDDRVGGSYFFTDDFDLWVWGVKVKHGQTKEAEC